MSGFIRVKLIDFEPVGLVVNNQEEDYVQVKIKEAERSGIIIFHI